VSRYASKLKISAIATVTFSAVVLLAPTAHADRASFLADVQAEGAFGQLPSGTVTVLGQMACQQLTRGNTAAVSGLQSAIVNDTHVSSTDAAQFVVLANRDLCPSA
jgi:hypothetical protein